MQVKNLNKVINLFLAGLFVLVLILVLSFSKAFGAIQSLHTDAIGKIPSNPSLILLLTLFMFTISIFLGILVEGLSSLFRIPLEIVTKKPLFVKFMCCSETANRYNYFKNEFDRAFELSKHHQNISHNPTMNRSLATAILFMSNNTQAIEWAAQHYSTYLLATNFIITIIIFFPITLFVISTTTIIKLVILIFFIASLYFLCHLAIDKLLYAYETTFRHGILWLYDSNSQFDGNEKKSKKPSRS